MKRAVNLQFLDFRIQLILLAFVTLASCGSKPQNDVQAIDEELNEIVESSEFKENGLMKQRPTEQVIDTKEGYKVNISVRPDETLPNVPNENFGTYCDNRVTVLVYNSTDTLVNRQLTKADFFDALDSNLKTYAILENLSLASSSGQSVTLDASVSVPHSDEQAIFTITLGFDGSMTMQKNMPANDAFPDEEGD